MEWHAGFAMFFGKPDDPAGTGVVFPFWWRHGAASGQGYLVFREAHGRLEPVGLTLGDPGSAGSVLPARPQPRVTTSILRVLPLGAIVAAGAKQAAELRDAVIAAASVGRFVTPLTPDELAEAEANGVPLLRFSGGTMMNEAEAAAAVAETAGLAAAFPPESGAARTGPKPLPDSHYRAVAEIYSHCDYPGGNPVQAVRQMYRKAFGVLVPRSTASRWVRQAEKKGFLGPAPGPGRVGRVRPESSEADE
jgi:hypothetical protein